MAVEMIPATAKYANGVDYEIKVDPNQISAKTMVNQDLTKVIKPAIKVNTRPMFLSFAHICDWDTCALCYSVPFHAKPLPFIDLLFFA